MICSDIHCVVFEVDILEQVDLFLTCGNEAGGLVGAGDLMGERDVHQHSFFDA